MYAATAEKLKKGKTLKLQLRKLIRCGLVFVVVPSVFFHWRMNQCMNILVGVWNNILRRDKHRNMACGRVTICRRGLHIFSRINRQLNKADWYKNWKDVIISREKIINLNINNKIIITLHDRKKFSFIANIQKNNRQRCPETCGSKLQCIVWMNAHLIDEWKMDYENKYWFRKFWEWSKYTSPIQKAFRHLKIIWGLTYNYYLSSQNKECISRIPVTWFSATAAG